MATLHDLLQLITPPQGELRPKFPLGAMLIVEIFVQQQYRSVAHFMHQCLTQLLLSIQHLDAQEYPAGT